LYKANPSAGGKVIARRITSSPAPQTCRITFIDPDYPDLDKVVRQLPVGVLTVSEGAHFTRDGGMIAFVISNRRVRFDISQTAAENGGIKLSSRLLGVARAVTK
jgi:hypothetical protein